MLKRSQTRWPEVVVIEAEVMVKCGLCILVYAGFGAAHAEVTA